MKSKLLILNLILACSYVFWLIWPALLNSAVGISIYVYTTILSIPILIIGILQFTLNKHGLLKTSFFLSCLQILFSGTAFSLTGFDRNLYETLYSTFTPPFHFIFINYLMSIIIPIVLVAINTAFIGYAIKAGVLKTDPEAAEIRKQKKIDKLDTQIEQLNQQIEQLNQQREKMNKD